MVDSIALFIPPLLKGKVLELDSQLGIGVLLGATAMGCVLRQDVQCDPHDIFPSEQNVQVHLPPNLGTFTLTNSHVKMSNTAFRNIKQS